MTADRYRAQVQLLVDALPLVAREAEFALKGGTAINLFYRDLPRLSVDIDLTYLPIKDRGESLAAIDAAFDRLVESISKNVAGATAQRIKGGDGQDTRLMVSRGGASIKIETSPVTRGSLYPPQMMPVAAKVEDEFGFAEMQVLAFEDLYAGKLHATVDRQHPRDLFDVHILYQNEGITDPLFRAFLAYIACSGRPPHELLKPTPKELDVVFAEHFEGMDISDAPVTLASLEETRTKLFDDNAGRLDDAAKRFILSLHDGEPDFDAIGLPRAAQLPAIRWKLFNLEKLKTNDPAKHAEQRRFLEELF